MKPRGKCFSRKCEDCNWWRQREFEKIENGMPSGVREMRWTCEIETLVNALHYHMGSLDGLQSATNESRNRAMETKAKVEDFGNAISGVVSAIEREMNRLVGINKKLLEDK